MGAGKSVGRVLTSIWLIVLFNNSNEIVDNFHYWYICKTFSNYLQFWLIYGLSRHNNTLDISNKFRKILIVSCGWNETITLYCVNKWDTSCKTGFQMFVCQTSCHTKRRLGRAKSSFGMTMTKIWRTVFTWHAHV